MERSHSDDFGFSVGEGVGAIGLAVGVEECAPDDSKDEEEEEAWSEGEGEEADEVATTEGEGALVVVCGSVADLLAEYNSHVRSMMVLKI